MLSTMIYAQIISLSFPLPLRHCRQCKVWRHHCHNDIARTANL